MKITFYCYIMSIKNLLTSNAKPDQNLQVESLTAPSIINTYTNLIADNATINDTLTSDNIVTNTLTANTSITTDVAVVSGLATATEIICDNFSCSGTANTSVQFSDTTTINTLTVTVQINLPPTPYTDIPLVFSGQFMSDITWSVNGLSSGVVPNGIRIVRLGTMCVLEIMPFTISGVSVSGPDLSITSNVVVPTDLRPSFMPILLKNTRLTESAVINPVTIRIEGGGDYTVNIQKFFANTYNTGAINISLPSNNSTTYLTT